MSQKPFLRDLIYFDFDKTASIISQIDSGLIKEERDEEVNTREIGGGLDVRLAKIGGKADDTRSKLVVRSTHHDLLVRVEDALFKEEVAVDINTDFSNLDMSTIEALHKQLAVKPYVRAEGMSTFQDYRRVKEYLDGVVQIAQLQQPKKTSKRKDQQSQDQMLKGFKSIVDLIMPNRNHLFVQPFESLHEFKIISNLKSECYVDRDPNNVLFHYGSQPNVRLTVFGLTTSAPNDGNNSSNLHLGKITESSDGTMKQISQVFGQVFDAVAPLEEFGQVTHYPSVTVYPLAVYRTITKQG